MAKVRTFSRSFPKGHPKQGQPTFFVEKIYKSLYLMKVVPGELVNDFNFAVMNDDNYKPKHHTIRAGNHFKVGDFFSPRVWSGKPYASKQITIATDIQVKKVWSFETYGLTTLLNNKPINHLEWAAIAENDGLSPTDLHDWLKPPFVGQIICWSDSVEY